MAEGRIAWFTPLQPVESGISLYSEDLLPILSTVLDVDVIVDGYKPTQLPQSARLRTVDYRDFHARNYDLVVYQVGNSPAHLYMLPEVVRTPGLLVLHDTVLNHLFIQRAAQDGTLLHYRDEMERRYGPEGRKAAERVLKGQAPDDLFRFPMSESLVRASQATIVHSQFARNEVLGWVPDAFVERVPHGLRMPEQVDRESARHALGLPLDQYLIASITHISPYKRIDVVLRAFRQLRSSVPARLILAGSLSPNFPLHRMIAHLGLDQVVDVPGYVEDQRARLISAAADVIVNLRYPTAGETSGSLLHSMAAGRPVLVSQTGSFTEAPPDTVIPVRVDALEEQTLLAMFQRLADDTALRDEMGRRAREFVEREHSLQRWANGYVNVIAHLTDRPVDYPRVTQSDEPVLSGWKNDGDPRSSDLTNSVARDIAELGLGGDDTLLRDVASASVELGLGVGKIMYKSEDVPQRAGEHP